MKQVLRSGASALGWAMLLMAPLVQPLVSPKAHFLYHWSGTPFDLFAPVLIDVAGVAATVALLLYSAVRPGRWRVLVWCVLLFTLPWTVLRAYVAVAQVPDPVHLPHLRYALIACVLFTFLLRPAWQVHYERVIGFVGTLLAFLGLSACLFLVQIAYIWWQARALNQPLPFHATQVSGQTPKGPGRVIWIVLDELAYQQVYGVRPVGLSLPAFDMLAHEATVFTHTIPAGNATDLVMPTLITGDFVDDIRAGTDGLLVTHDPQSKRWMNFPQHDTVFQDALDAGYSTAIAGWYNPYCRILNGVLDQCFWIFGNTLAGEPKSEGTADNDLLAAAQNVSLGDTTFHDRLIGFLNLPQYRNLDAKDHVLDFRRISAAADHLLADPSSTFVLLHMPVPHPDGIYNRRTGQLTTTGKSTYVDNLALADKFLAHVESTLRQSGQWDSSAVLVMGDHSWRTNTLWKPAGLWTPEEEKASFGATFDDRPVYAVKFPNQTQGNTVDEPFPALATRALLKGIISGNVLTPAALQQQLSSYRSVRPVP